MADVRFHFGEVASLRWAASDFAVLLLPDRIFDSLCRTFNTKVDGNGHSGMLLLSHPAYAAASAMPV